MIPGGQVFTIPDELNRQKRPYISVAGRSDRKLIAELACGERCQYSRSLSAGLKLDAPSVGHAPETSGCHKTPSFRGHI